MNQERAEKLVTIFKEFLRREVVDLRTRESWEFAIFYPGSFKGVYTSVSKEDAESRLDYIRRTYPNAKFSAIQRVVFEEVA